MDWNKKYNEEARSKIYAGSCASVFSPKYLKLILETGIYANMAKFLIQPGI